MNNADQKKIEDILGRMSLREKIGQCITMNHTGFTIESYEERFVNDFFCGGLRMTPHVVAPVTDNSDTFQLRKLAPYATPVEYASTTRKLQEMALERNGIPLHLVTDQEGDLSVDILRGGIQLFPSSMGIASSGDPNLAYESARAIARQLRAQGINWMHSPVVDVNIQPTNPEIGMRAFSDDPDICADFAIAMMKGFLDGGVMPTAKHFPGRGDSVTDAHDSLDVSTKPLEDILATELYPYRKMIEDGAYFTVMTAHQAFSSLDSENVPASLSYKITTELLRQDMGFTGVITTDAISMAGAIDYAGSVPEAVLMALQAGADLVLMKTPEEDCEQSLELIHESVLNGGLRENLLDEKVTRILEAKSRLGLFEIDFLHSPEKAEEPIKDSRVINICTQAFLKASIVTRDRDKLLPLPTESLETVLVIEQYVQLYHEKGNDRYYHPGMFSEFIRLYSKNIVSIETDTPATIADEKRVADKMELVDTVIFFNTFWRGSGSNRKLIRTAVESGKKVIVATNDLYDSYFLPTVGTVICTFGAVPQGLRAAARIIFGLQKSEGSWPLRLLSQDETATVREAKDHFVAGHFSVR